MSRVVRHDPPPPLTEPREEDVRCADKTVREERFAEAQAKILQDYAETFRRLSE